MLTRQTTIHATEQNSTLTDISISSADNTLRSYGYCLLRGFDVTLEDFSQLIQRLCTEVTYDPARQMSSDSVQKVDAGTDAIGLHIENGNTPRIPHLLAFYCKNAPITGSQTTICDGIDLLNEMPQSMQQIFKDDMTVTRTLPEPLWKAYLAQEHPALQSASQVTEQHLQQMIAAIPGQSATVNADESLTYSVSLPAIRVSPLSEKKAFANAIMGPSFNYEPPTYQLGSGKTLDCGTVNHLRELAEEQTQEIAWQQNDVLLLDNWRVMHGRRAIQDAGNRELFIGMGSV